MSRKSKARPAVVTVRALVVTLLIGVSALIVPAGASAAFGDCSQPVTNGATAAATDCLFILRAAVGLGTCNPECICAPAGRLPIAATGALACLRAAVGQAVELRCPCDSASTTTLPMTGDPIMISSVTPTDGTVGTMITITGSGFDDGNVQVLLAGSTEIALDVIEVQADRIVARLVSAAPAGAYKVKAVGAFSSDVSEDTFEVRLPTNLVFEPPMTAAGLPVTMRGAFLGSEPGQIALRSRADPAATQYGAEILSWSDNAAVFIMSSALPSDGPVDVIVTNLVGSVTAPAGVRLDGGPRVVSAVATSNTEVLLQFSEPIQGGMESAENPAHYRIAGPSLARTATVGISSATLVPPSFSTVKLTTRSQSDILYRLTATSIFDLAGNPIPPPSILVDPSTTTFVGIPPSGAQIDSDGDGLTDSDEQRGWFVTVYLGDAKVETWHVTSDPGDPGLAADHPVNLAARDTDDDGVTDNEEKHGGLDPRSPDTDGDILTDNHEWNIIYSDPTNQDSDGDGTQDGFEFYSYRTSPLLADTDGDQINDTEEVTGRNRDPRIADLPLYSFNIGDVRLQIDERFTFEDFQGETVTTDSSSSVTLTHGENTTRNVSSSAFAQAILDLPGGISRDNSTPFAETNVTFSGGLAVQISRESTVESQRVREESLAKAKELATSSTVTREIVGARIDADLTIENRGDLAFAITNLEVTVLQRSRESTRRFVPVATLIANRTLITGEPATFNLGPFTPVRGPILFTSRDVFPNLVDELMQLPPGGLIFEVVNFDITDEFGRQFTFANQTARDRTAGIIVDPGDGQVARSLLATALQPDPDGFGGPPGGFVGGFNGDGSPKGIPLDFALQDIMELTKNATAEDGVVAGGNQVAETIATGDDVQQIPPGTTGVGVGSIVVSAGQDGVLESLPLGDDQAEVTTGYETSLTCSSSSGANARKLCDADLQCSPGTCTGPETLVRFGSQRNGDFDRQWVVLTTGQIAAGADFGRLMLEPGEDFYFAFVQDLDQDGIFAREEFLSGSTDSRTDVYANDSFGDGEFGAYDLVFDDDGELVGFAVPPPVAEPDGIPDSKDTDRDGLGDFAELRVGWKVSADGGPLLQVFSSPRLADSDGDGMLDPQEQDLSPFCFPLIDGGDSRQDALCSFQLDPPVARENALAIIAGADGAADSLAVNDDEQLVAQGTTGLTLHTPVVGPGADGILDTLLSGDDQYESAESRSRIPPASNPILSDTDADGVEDFPELNAYLVGLSILDGNTVVPPGQARADTLAIGDDIQQAFLGGPVFPGGIVVLPGPNGTLESTPGGDDVVQAGEFVVTDPLRRDTDADLVSDGRERDQGGDPTNPLDGEQFRDSDQDGLSDSEESVLGWLVSVNRGAPRLVLSNPSRPDSDFDGLPDFAERVLLTDPNNPDTENDGLRDFDEVADFEQFFGLDAYFPGFSIDGASSQQYGTDPNDSDTDGDRLPDDFELLTGYRVLVGGESTFRQVFTNPLQADTDLDGVADLDEVVNKTDATDPDTDDDGRSDGVERAAGTDPLVPDVGVTVTFGDLLVDRIVDPGGAGGAELSWFFTIETPQSGSAQLVSSPLDLFSPPIVPVFFFDGVPSQLCYEAILTPGLFYTLPINKSVSFTLKEGQSFEVKGIIFELDDAADDCGSPPRYIPTWVRSGCVTRFAETFSFEDFADGGQATFPFPNGEGTTEGCDWTLEIDVQGR